jgi:hypothetical protein
MKPTPSISLNRSRLLFGFLAIFFLVATLHAEISENADQSATKNSVSPPSWAASLSQFDQIAWKAPSAAPFAFAGIKTMPGAKMDESIVKKVVEAHPAPSGDQMSLRQAWEAVRSALDAGIPVKLLLEAGVYRESLSDATPLTTNGLKTLLIIEGKGLEGAVFEGSDVVPVSDWRGEGGGIWSMEWTNDFGNATLPWGADFVIAHRREMVFADGEPLKQILLEKYSWKKAGNWSIKTPATTYEGFSLPADTLKPGTFGVAEREENGNRLYIRLPEGKAPDSTLLEVSFRGRCLVLENKKNLVLRNLTFQRFCNGLLLVENMFEGPVMLGKEAANVLVENCAFLQNNGMGLHLRGSDVTVRRSQFNHNGYSGIQTNFLNGSWFFENETNFNNWRGWSGKVDGWFVGGVKFHQTKNQVTQRHVSIGNLCPGFWYDIDCHNVFNEDIITFFNQRGVFWELSQGPFEGNRILSAFNKAWFHMDLRASIIGSMQLRNSIFYNTAPDSNLVTLVWYLRKDRHAKVAQVKPGIHELTNSAIISAVPVRGLLAVAIRFWEDPAMGAGFEYRGSKNTFFSPNQESSFVIQRSENKFDDLSFADWMALGQEQKSGWEAPPLANPLELDFTLPTDYQGTYSDVSLLSAYKVPTGYLGEARRFFNTHVWPISQKIEGFLFAPDRKTESNAAQDE